MDNLFVGGEGLRLGLFGALVRASANPNSFPSAVFNVNQTYNDAMMTHNMKYVTHHIKLGIKVAFGVLRLCTPAYSLHQLSFILIPILSLYHYWFLRY
jgi:hypothetical protein